jgi:hydrocephalus-inducing protein
MEDRRRPFTPLVQPDTPTPEPSPSPRGRKKKDKESVETSVSPPRKPIKDTKDSKDAKKDAKDPKGAAIGKKPSEKVPEKVEKLDDTIKSVKGGKKGKEKDGKDADEPRKETSTNLEMADTARDDNLRADSQAQMRAESALSYQAPSIMSESGYVPFSVEPAFGKLEPGKTQLFKIKFAPLDCNDYQARLTCLIPNLEDGKQGPVVAVKGRGLLPYCHFDLEESDYITAGRRDPERPGPGGDISNVGLDSMTKVIEFKSVGLFTKCVKQFDIVNPTNIDYEYEWVREDPNNIQQAEMFSCINEKGILKSGRRQEIIFEFTPNDFGTHESFWKFKSAKYNLEVPFLLIGDVSKPKVVFDRSHVLFKPLLIGMLGHETVNIINQENKPFEFKFDTNSCYTEGRSEVVLIEPCNGTVGALSRIPIKLSLKPRDQRQLVFNLKCMLSNSSKPMLLNVKGEGFSMQTTLYCEDNIGNKVEFGEGNINEIHFGEVEKNEIAFRNLYILNVGKFKIDFDCYLASEIDESLSCFSIEPQKVSVDPGQKQQCVLKYHAKKERPSISNLVIKVDHGAVYHIHIDGIAVRPDVQFSFYEYNFGPCFIYKAGMPVQSIKLNILNAGSKETNVDCLFNNSSVNSCFLIDFKQTILMPKESTTMSISFIPRECMKYEEKVLFELNGLTRREICLKGVGTDMKIELVDSKQKVLDVGTLEVGKSSKKVVKIVNKSVASIEFNLLFEPKSEILIENKQILQISPYQGIKLKPNQVLDLQVTFKPKSRIPKFYEEIKLEYNGICTPLFAINGACHGYNIWMDSNALPFGAVVQKCSTIKRVVMHNEGDIGACFKWEVDRLKPDFSIEPTHGYISPGMDVSFDITFSPQELSADIRKDNIKCILEGCPALAITLTGSCIQSVPQKEVQYFDTFARQKESKQINIQNKTNSIWEIKPVIEGEYFSGIESITVEPQSIKAYDIVYSPLSMTLEGKKHLGTCFFPLPDGTGLSYNLIGTSGSPKASGRITRDVPCKLQTTEVLLIENWLKKPQRFKIIYEFIKPDKPDLSTTIKGHDYIDVPGNGKKEYKLSYFAHKEGITQVKVIFKNEQTLEYLFYELSFKAVKGGSIGTIDLVTPVRVSTQYSLKMENPLPTAVNFTLTCTNNTEVLIPTNVQIVAKGQVS